MSTPEVDWSLLPDEPARFFCLPAIFDREMLRTQYHALLHRFKPEQHPEEFKRIRMAYEQLDRKLRYRRLPSNLEAPAPGDGSNLGPPPSLAVDHAASHLELSRPGLLGRLADASPDSLYQELRQLVPKAPDHYHMLALLGDIVEQEHVATFGSWLLEGLRVHRRDVSLIRLFTSYARRGAPSEHAMVLVQTASKALDRDLFYYVTEPLWLALGRDLPFASWRTLLDESEANVTSESLHSRIAFRVRMTQAMVWRADPSWIAEELAWLQSHFVDLDGRHQSEVDTIELLDQYRRAPRPVRQSPWCARIDRVLRVWVEQDEPEIDREFLACQQEMVSSREALLAAYPIKLGRRDPAYLPYSILSHEVAARWLAGSASSFAMQPTPNDVDRAHGVLNKAQRRAQWLATPTGFVCTSLAFLWVLLFAVAYVAVPIVAALAAKACLARRLPHWDLTPVTAGIAMVLLIVQCVCAHKRFLAPLFRFVRDRIWLLCYRRLWRMDLMQLVHDTHVSHARLINAIRAVDDPRCTWSRHLASFVSVDDALAYYAIAVKFAG